MTTLKQILENYGRDDGHYKCPIVCYKEVIEAVEEWLKQKLDEPYKVQPKETTIRELLKELKEK